MTKKTYKPADKIKVKGIKLRYFRERQGLTLKQLAEETGINSGTISKFENGTYSLPRDQAIKISEALGVSYTHMCEPYEFTRSNWGTAVRPKPKKAKKEKVFVPDQVAPVQKKRKKRKSESEMNEKLQLVEAFPTKTLGTVLDNTSEVKSAELANTLTGEPIAVTLPRKSAEASLGAPTDITGTRVPKWLEEQAGTFVAEPVKEKLPESISVEIVDGIPRILVTGYEEVVFTTEGVTNPRVKIYK